MVSEIFKSFLCCKLIRRFSIKLAKWDFLNAPRSFNLPIFIKILNHDIFSIKNRKYYIKAFESSLKISHCKINFNLMTETKFPLKNLKIHFMIRWFFHQFSILKLIWFFDFLLNDVRCNFIVFHIFISFDWFVWNVDKFDSWCFSMKCFWIEYHINGIKKENSTQLALETLCAKWNNHKFPEVLSDNKPSEMKIWIKALKHDFLLFFSTSNIYLIVLLKIKKNMGKNCFENRSSMTDVVVKSWSFKVLAYIKNYAYL